MIPPDPPPSHARRTNPGRWLAAAAAAVLLLGLTPAAAQAREAAPDTGSAPPVVAPQVREQLAAGGNTDFWVYLREEAELTSAAAIRDRAEQGRFVYERLTRTADRSQAGLTAMLAAEGVPYESFWIANTVRVRGDARLLERIAARPEVAQIVADQVYALPEPIPSTAEPAVAGVEWNVDRIGAPQVWSTYAATGAGIVVGTIDSGAQFDHPALVRQYRGNLGDGSSGDACEPEQSCFDHNYNWHDPSEVCGRPSLAPCDNTGHGTHVIGTIVGDDGGDNQIGVAPGAQWIAAKGCESSAGCSTGALLSAGQFMLAPTDLEGNNADPARRPHIVNNSWGGRATADPWYQPTVRAWLAAGIFPQFANGNTRFGMAPCGSASNPGNLPEVYSAGAFDVNNEIAIYSNRGPSAWDADLVKPDIAAPGTNVRSAVPGDGYEPNSGTSMAAPHVAGAVALLWSAADALVRDVDATRDLLDRTAVDVEDLTCGGEPGNNNVWGQGRLDVLAAMAAAPLGPAGQLAGAVSDADTGDPIAGARLVVAGTQRPDPRTGADGGYAVRLPVGEYSVTVSAFGYQSQTVPVRITEGETTTADFSLEPAEMATVTGALTDGSGHGWPLYAEVAVAGTPAATFTDPVTGRYELTLPAGESYQLRVTPHYPGYAGTTETVQLGADDLVRDLALEVDSCEQAPGYEPGDGCQPVPGGLVVGQVTDANTGAAVNDASVDGAGGSGGSVATPDDPARDDGFYWLFSAVTGSVPLTAGAEGYAEATRDVTVAGDAAVVADFSLAAGELTIEPAGVAAELRLGQSTERTVTFANTGTAPARVELGELPGSFQVRGGGSRDSSQPPGGSGEVWQPVTGLVPDPSYDPDSPTTEGQYLVDPRAQATPYAPGDVLAAWRPTGLGRAWGVGFDGEVWLSDGIFYANHEFTVTGQSTGVQHPGLGGDAWPADMALHTEDEMCQVRAGGDNAIVCWDTGTGELTRSIAGEFPWTEMSQRGLAYRADDDTFYIGGWNQDTIYQVRGFSHDTPGEVVRQCFFPTLGISGLAWNPTAELMWVASNSPTDEIFLVDPARCEVLDALGHPTPGYNGGGLHLDDAGNLWMVSQDNSGALNTAYLVDSGIPDVSDVPWLEQDPAAVTLAPGEHITVELSLDSAATSQRQPGTYTAALHLAHDTPYEVDRVNVTMDVTPPSDWGLIRGTVTGTDCGGAVEQVPAGAVVTLDGRYADAEVVTDTAGRYAYWMAARNNPVQVRASAIGYQPGAAVRVVVVPRRERGADFALPRRDEFGYTCGTDDIAYGSADTVLPITGKSSTGILDLPFPFRFYGQEYAQVRVCSNGFVEFVDPDGGFAFGCFLANDRLPTPSQPGAAIHPFWDSGLFVDAEASIRADVAGAAPARRLVIEFRNLSFVDTSDPELRVNFNVVLHENGDIHTQYRDIADDQRAQGAGATIGIEDHTGTLALQYAFRQPVLPAGPGVTSVRYQPPAEAAG